MRFPTLTLIISIALGALYGLFGATPEALIWHHNSADAWRWVSGHFVHISAAHLAWNLIALIVLGSILEQYRRRDVLFSLLAGTITINLYLASAYSLPAYAGLSGILNSLLVVALYRLCSSETYRHAALLTLIGSMLKIIIEMNIGASLVANLSWPPVPEAHFFGWLAGVAMCIMLGIKKQSRFRLAQ